jgi:hypothetical protein
MNDISITGILKIIKMFAGRQIEEKSKELEFDKIDRGLTAKTFIMALTMGLWSVHEITLDIISNQCEKRQPSLTLTKQALSKKMKTGAVLMQEILGMAMDHATKNSFSAATMKVLKQFKDVIICDSTTISLPKKLKNLFEGLGGKNAIAALKVQALFSVIKKTFVWLQLFSAKCSDGSFTAKIVERLKAGELIIFDLGYFSIKSFKDIMAKGAYFVSRVKTNALYYINCPENDGVFKEINILHILRNSEGVVDQWIYVSGKKLHVRLVAIRLPEDKINERRRKANKKAKQNGKTLSSYELELLAWNILITNVSEKMLSFETICELYRIRWQIELIFKSWKGCFEIDKMNNVGEDYFKCIFYGKLIVITLMTALYSTMHCIVFTQNETLLSFARFFKNFRENLDIFIDNLKYSCKSAGKIISIINDAVKRSLEEKRKRKTTERTIIQHVPSYFVLQMLD